MLRGIRGVAAGIGLVAAAWAQPVVVGFERFYAQAAEEARLVDGGVLLLNELNCVACHAAPEGWRERLPGRGKIRLAGIGQRLAEKTIADYVAAPGRMEPGTTMPRIAHHAAEADAIAAYLVSLRPMPGAARNFPKGDAQRGRKLFESGGCAACHAPTEGATTYASVPLGLAPHAERNALAAFIQNPLHTRPAGRMPATELSDAEAADLAAYLAPAVVTPAGNTARGDVTLGRTRFATLNCAACHDVGDNVTQKAARVLADVRIEEGCLAANPSPEAPNFALNEVQRRALVAALRALQAAPKPPALSAEQRVTAKFEQLNCYACHEWRGRGGAEPARAKHFTATDAAAESLGEIGHIPPKLDQAGRKLTPAWLEKLLWGQGGGVRPYMTARMPRFGEAVAGELVGLLAEVCRPEQLQTIDVSGSLGHQRFATGRTLLGTSNGGIGCVACHGIKGREPSGVRAINLTHTAQRLQPEYFKALLLDPQGMQPGTIMPPLFAGRKSADKEIESIWTYFKELDQSNVLPDGLAVVGSFELKPQEEGRPIVFRTFLEGAGTQAIAVGFPAGVNAAFDAFEARWALAWRGKYLDAQSNWEERPMKPIKPLGQPVRALPPHLPLARLREVSEPWPAQFGAYAGYVFKGYRLAADGTPTFRYAIDGIEVEDTLRPAADGASLRRTLTLRGGGTGDGGAWYFRGLGSGVEPQPVEWRNGTATIEETLTF